YTSVFSIWFTSNGSSGSEDLAQGGGEGIRLAGLTVFAAEEATVVAREGDRRDPEPFGHGRARTAGQLLAGLGADADHDTGRRRAQGIEVVPVRIARNDVVAQQRVVPGPVVLGRQPEHGEVRAGLIGIVVSERALVADDRDELRHRRTE